MLTEGTPVPLFTAVADVWGVLVLRAEFFFEVLADSETVRTALRAVLCPPVTAGSADIPTVLASVPKHAGIKAAAAILDDEVISDLFGNRRRIFPNESTNLREVGSIPKCLFNFNPIA